MQEPTDGDELIQLRSRVYGPTGSTPVTPADLARLQELEEAKASTSDPDGGNSTQDESSSVPSPTGAEEPSKEATGSSAHTRRGTPKWRTGALLAAMSALLLLLGFAVGLAVALPRPSGTPPELERPQTEEDVLPSGSTDGVFASSSRFIARVDGVDVYLALPAGYEGLCIVIVDLTSGERSSTSCAGGGPVGAGMSAAVSENLSIVVGDDKLLASGEPIQLSESVTAYQR